MATDIELWLSSPIGGVVLVVFGLVIGSTLNVVISRLPVLTQREEISMALRAIHVEPAVNATFNLAWPASFCTSCRTPIRKAHLIPVLSWLWLRGRCAACDRRIPVRYPVVELLTALICLLAFMQYGFSIDFAFNTIFCWVLIVLAFMDWETGWLPDSLTWPLIAGGLLFSTLDPDLLPAVSPTDAIIGSVAGYAVFAFVNFCHRLLRGAPGMGGGDIKLAAAMGAWFGWVLLPFLVLLATVCATLYAAILILMRRYDQKFGIRYAPFVAFAAIGLLFLRDGNLLPEFLTF